MFFKISNIMYLHYCHPSVLLVPLFLFCSHPTESGPLSLATSILLYQSTIVKEMDRINVQKKELPWSYGSGSISY